MREGIAIDAAKNAVADRKCVAATVKPLAVLLSPDNHAGLLEISHVGILDYLTATGQLVGFANTQPQTCVLKLAFQIRIGFGDFVDPVSYTHLTLPTKA